MDTKINFFRIGLFVSVISFLLILAIFWLGKYGLEDKKYDIYYIYFDMFEQQIEIHQYA